LPLDQRVQVRLCETGRHATSVGTRTPRDCNERETMHPQDRSRAQLRAARAPRGTGRRPRAGGGG
jgi:hypothetical protein